ncbi:zf-CCHC domain-containing protein [Tanacetum coccineum]
MLQHQGNSQVKDNKIDFLVQQYEQFTILEEESIDSGFARFNTIITSLKALDEGFSSKKYVRKFLRTLHTKWRAKVTAIEESNDLSSLALDELIDNIKVHEVVMDEKKGKSDRKCFRCGDPNHLIDDCPKPPRNKDQKAFIGGSWSNSKNDAEDKTNDETCLMAQSSNENRILKTKRDILEKEILELNEKIKKLERNKGIDVTCESCQELKLENAKLKETQIKFVKFDKSANLLKEMLNNQKYSSCKMGLEFDNSKASTSGTKPMSFVGSSAKNATDGSIKKVHRSTIPGSVNPSGAEKVTEHVFSPHMSSRSDFVITRKKLIHNRTEELKKPSLKPSFKSSLGYVKTESRSKTPSPRRNIFSQPRYNIPQPRRNSREPMHQTSIL